MTIDKLVIPGLFAVLLAVGCDGGDDTDPQEADTDTDTDSDTDTDADTDSDTDADTDSDTDADTDSDTDTDTDSPMLVDAIAGSTCAAGDRIGLVEIVPSGTTGYARGAVRDRPDPNVGALVQQSGGCAYHEWDSSSCLAITCGPGTVCGYDPAFSNAGCVPSPEAFPGLAVRLSDGADTQTLTVGVDGSIDEPVDAAIDLSNLSIEVEWDGVLVTSPPQSVPTDDLSPVSLTLAGDSCAPGAGTVTWTDAGSGGFAYTLTNNNHHLPQDRFTECFTAASAESEAIPASMLDPLSGSTCLEFQSVRHLQVAAANVPEGCIELRWEGPNAFPSF